MNNLPNEDCINSGSAYLHEAMEQFYIQAEGIEVIENNGFKGNKAELKVKMPSPTSNMDLIVIEDYIPFTITVKDGEGKTYYCDEMKPLILEKSDSRRDFPFSISSTLLPAFASLYAAALPAAPPPTTTHSA